MRHPREKVPVGLGTSVKGYMLKRYLLGQVPFSRSTSQERQLTGEVPARLPVGGVIGKMITRHAFLHQGEIRGLDLYLELVGNLPMIPKFRSRFQIYPPHSLCLQF